MNASYIHVAHQIAEIGLWIVVAYFVVIYPKSKHGFYSWPPSRRLKSFVVVPVRCLHSVLESMSDAVADIYGFN